MFTPGDKLEYGHYTVLRELGSGGMGVVYHCRDEFLQREIAIKMMLPELMSEEDTVEVFRSEARLAAQLEHPNIVTIHNIGMETREGNVHHYIAMEFLPGGSLKQRIGKEVVPLEQALEWMKQLSTALHYAHKRGVVHQDIKPDNIFITQEGNLKIGDFGLALIATGRAFERAAQGKGTPAYMSPELCKGEPRDHRSDIYSLGAVFFEILAGQRPFKANGMIEMALKHATAPVPSVNKYRNDIPVVLDRCVQNMLAKGPEERVQSLADVVSLLDKLLLEIKVARLGMAPPQAGDNFSRVLMGPEPVENSGSETVQSFQSMMETLPSDMDPTKKYEMLREAGQSAFESEFARSLAELGTGQPQNTAQLPEESILKPAAGGGDALDKILTTSKSNPNLSKEIQSAFSAHERDSCTRQLDCLWTFQTSGPVGWCASPVVNRAKKLVLIGSADGILYALDSESGHLKWFFENGGPIVASPQFAGNNLVLGCADGSVRAIDSANGKEIWKYLGAAPCVSSPDVGNDSVFVGFMDGEIVRLNISTGQRIWKANIGAPIVSSPQVFESQVVLASRDGRVMSLNSESGVANWTFDAKGSVVSSPQVSTDSVYVGTTEGHIHALEPDSGVISWEHDVAAPIIAGGTIEFTAVTFFAGETVYSFEKYKGGLVWKTKLAGAVCKGILSNFGRLYATTRNGFLQCFNARSGDLQWQMKSDRCYDAAPSVSGSSIFVAATDGAVSAYNAPVKQ